MWGEKTYVFLTFGTKVCDFLNPIKPSPPVTDTLLSTSLCDEISHTSLNVSNPYVIALVKTQMF